LPLPTALLEEQTIPEFERPGKAGARADRDRRFVEPRSLRFGFWAVARVWNAFPATVPGFRLFIGELEVRDLIRAYSVAGVVTGSYNAPMITNVRAAKAHLSELLDRAAAGEEIVITSDGKPKARIVPLGRPRVPYRAHWRLLEGPQKRRATRAEAIVRADRDGRD
jgi:prevent-host-death family protein